MTSKSSIGLPGLFYGCRVFCSPTYKLYRDKTTLLLLPGPAKNSPVPGLAATNHTGWPLGGIARAKPRQSTLENLA